MYPCSQNLSPHSETLKVLERAALMIGYHSMLHFDVSSHLALFERSALLELCSSWCLWIKVRLKAIDDMRTTMLDFTR